MHFFAMSAVPFANKNVLDVGLGKLSFLPASKERNGAYGGMSKVL
jgi:hypothetical protein